MTSTLVRRLADRARALGFDHLGVCGPTPSARAIDAYRRWIAAGMAGEMGYLARPDRVARALDPRGSLPQSRSVVVVALHYGPGEGSDEHVDPPSRGQVAAYARGADYHAVVLSRLDALAEWLGDELGRPVAHRAYVDSGPVLERDAAVRAGLGFVGRNTMLIHPRRGSWSFLATLFVDVDLTDDGQGPGNETDPCGGCRRCLDACPTGALPAPRVLDGRRCISALTIEHKGPIPRELRPLLGNRIFGCDVCNDACPYNRRFARSAADADLEPRPDTTAPRLLELVALDEAAFRARFAGTPLARPKRRGLLRNVCVAIGNWGDPASVPLLSRALRDDEPLVRGHAAWALGRIGTAAARRALDASRAAEPDPWAREETVAALACGS